MINNKKKKIIILTYYRFPCSHPVLENVFARELGREHDITWLFQGDISKGRKRKWHNSQVLLSREIKGNYWYSKLANRILQWGIFFRLLGLLWQDETKIVLIRDMPLMALLIAPLRPLFGFKFYFQYSAPQGDMFIDCSKSIKSMKRFWYFLSGSCYNMIIHKVIATADIVFPISDFHKSQLLRYTRPDKLVPVTMGIDEQWLRRDKGQIPHLAKLKRRHSLLVYFGAFGPIRNPQFLLKAFAELKDKNANCKLILILKRRLDLGEKERMQEICLRLGIAKDTIFMGPLNRRELQDYLSYYDVSISPIPPTEYFKISSPTKLYESLSQGLPVVANKEIHEQEKVILESGGGILVDYNTTAFCNAVDRLLKDKKLRRQMGQKGRKYVIANYCYRDIAKKISHYFT